MAETIDPTRDAGWYPDPERAHTLRYWDGDAWTDDRAPGGQPESTQQRGPESADQPRLASGWMRENGRLTAQGRYAVGVALASLGAAIAIVGVFLPLADTESSLHIAKNSLIQHWEGPVIIGVAIAGLLSALHPTTRPLAFLAGGALGLVAVLSGTNLPIEFRNEFSRVVAGEASPGAGIWAVGAGGALLALSALFADWGALTSGTGTDGRSGMSRFEELMSGQEASEEAFTGDPVSAPGNDDAADVETGTSPPKSRRRRFEEIMSGQSVSDVDPDGGNTDSPD